jgi:hypothetical protein
MVCLALGLTLLPRMRAREHFHRLAWEDWRRNPSEDWKRESFCASCWAGWFRAPPLSQSVIKMSERKLIVLCDYSMQCGEIHDYRTSSGALREGAVGASSKSDGLNRFFRGDSLHNIM